VGWSPCLVSGFESGVRFPRTIRATGRRRISWPI
jgi:hypothetical protein